MTTKPKAKKFRIRRDSPMGQAGEASTPGAAAAAPSVPAAMGPTDLDAIRSEGLTGRQLRMARRVAQKQGLAVTSDFDAVHQLRATGIDPFQRNTILGLVAPEGGIAGQGGPAGQSGSGNQEIGRIQLPQAIPTPGPNLPSTERVGIVDKRAREIYKMQRDIAKRRRRKLALLLTRLSFFVFLPTLLVGYYFTFLATPMFATNSEFVIQQAEPASGAGGLGGMFAGTSMATQQDSITVQSYLASRAALVRLNEDHGFKDHFSDESVDEIQRLSPDATNENVFSIYKKRVKISYDPTEGILRMEVIAANPEASQLFSEALIGYAEEQVDQLTRRLREDQMAGARSSYEKAEFRRSEALAEWLQIQEDTAILDPISQGNAIIQQVSSLETQRQQLVLSLAAKMSVRRPNEAQVAGLNAQIVSLESLILDLRNQMTAVSANGSIASRNTELRIAEENYNFQLVIVQQALAQMEAAQIEASRQVRYLSLGVEPVAPDEATYPRAFENTVLAFLVFAGIYLMISLTSSILREQVTA
ncbi:MAG: capsular polysaccharide transport system permease protein [Candidatus Azotimanducaceae bacterium]|jgi:capsular polysaccharide transport system permease protein